MLELEVNHSDQECKENHDGYLADEAESNNSKVTPTVYTRDKSRRLELTGVGMRNGTEGWTAHAYVQKLCSPAGRKSLGFSVH